VKNDKGHIVHWGCETLSPGKLVRAGWDRDSVKAGDEVIITLVAAKNVPLSAFFARFCSAKPVEPWWIQKHLVGEHHSLRNEPHTLPRGVVFRGIFARSAENVKGGHFPFSSYL